MINAKSYVAHRLLAAFLSMMMVLSIIPFSITANASTTAHPDKVTVTVVDDETNEPIEGAKVSFTIYDNDANSEVAGGTDELTDENGEVAVLDAVSGDISISKITVSHDDYEIYSDEAYNQPIKSLDDNFVIKLTCKKIRDVEISGKTLTYNGNAQELVSVTEVEGDTVMYELNGGVPTSDRPMATAVGIYNIKVTVTRAGKENLEKDVTTTIEPAKTGIKITPKTGLKYNGSAQELVEVDGLEENDIVTWEINGVKENSHDVPKREAVGKYTIKLTVNRGSNYEVFVSDPIEVEIALGEINLGDLTITANDRTYDTTTQPLLNAPENVGDYTLKYSEDEQTWSEAIPEKTDAGEYQVWVKAIKENYEDKDTLYFPITVTIRKADQHLSFNNYKGTNGTYQLTDEFPYGKEYDFSAADEEALAGGTITYEIAELDEDGIASIDAVTGLLTVDYPGTIKIKATLSGNKNYNDCVIEYTLEISGAVASNGQYIAFENDNVNYVLGTSDTVADQVANKSDKKIKGNISYALDSIPGVVIDENTGKVTVSNYDDLAEAIDNTVDGVLKSTVTATKANSGRYGRDIASYVINITFERTPDSPYTLSDTDGTYDWYKTKATITPATGYSIAQKASGAFGENTEFRDQGTDVRYVYLKNITTGGITGKIAVNIKIDTVKPDATKMKISYSESIMDKVLSAITFGYYNPSVTVTFTAEDETSGLNHLDWKYTRQDGASTANLAEESGTLSFIDGKAELTLTGAEAKQYRGSLSFTATDNAGNTSDLKTDADHVIVVDTISPNCEVSYANPKTEFNGKKYFEGDIELTFTVTETNFYEEDFVVQVSKDGGEEENVSLIWEKPEAAGNVFIGKYTLTGDGDYVVSGEYKDRSSNRMQRYQSDVLVIDTIAPDIKFSYDENDQKTTIIVTEHNFRLEDIIATVTANDVKGNKVNPNNLNAELQTGDKWTHDGDSHTFETSNYVNGIYTIKFVYTDLVAREETLESGAFIVDHDIPSAPEISYSKSLLDTVLGNIFFGFYNPTVDVTFTSYDSFTGVDHFTWSYVKQTGASDVNVSAYEGAEVAAQQDSSDKSKYTATITLPLKEAEQLRGSIAATATDKYGNISEETTDSGKVIVVDTVSPIMTVEYSEVSNKVGNTLYYGNDNDGKAEITFKVTEANFFAEDVVVKVSRNGETAVAVSPSWTDVSADEHIGIYTLFGDGHYIVSVEYKDRSNNEMTSYTSNTITIDTIEPVIEVVYQNDKKIDTIEDNDKNSWDYFDKTQTAVVTIREHNFDPKGVQWLIEAKDAAGNDLGKSEPVTDRVQQLIDAKLINMSDWRNDPSDGDIHTCEITYSGDANYTFDVDYSDLANNASGDYIADHFTVDTVAPRVTSVSYSSSILDTVLSNISFGFYNAKMTVTITAEDDTAGVHKFNYSYRKAVEVSTVNAELINEAISAADIKYSAGRKTATVTFEIPKDVLGNDNQFNGTVEFTATDRAGNTTDTHKETKRIVVDNIAPTAQVSYNEATNVVGDISYYNGDITATVTINEANFYAGDVQVMVSKDGGAATAVTPTWKDNSVDVHVGTFTITGDGDYVVTINYNDKSSNKMATYTSKQMTVDTKIEAPTYTINGAAKTEVGGAYKGDATIGFNFNDQNFDTKNITLTRTRFDKVEDVTAEFVKVNDNNKGGSGSFSIPSEVGNDGIYVLKISMTDKAKHQTESQVKFTINRFGSVYEYSDKLVDLIKDGGQYVTSVKDDLVITEYNADRILEGSLKILITRDGEAIDVAFTSNPAVINDTVGIGESGWYQYVYTIKASNFEKDGVYKISLTSKYAADDSDENDSTSVPDNSIDSMGNKILDSMNFTVDSVAPEIRNIVNLDKKIADRDKIVDGKLNVKYTVVDVGGLKSIEIIVNGVTVQTLTEKEIADDAFNFTGSFDIEEQNSATAQTVRIKVTDLAGNVTDTDSDDFLKAHSEDNENSTYIFYNELTVSRNFFVRWYANKVLFWGSIGGVVVLAAVVCFLIAAKKKKHASAE